MNLAKLNISFLVQLIFCISIINAGLIFKRDVAIDDNITTTETTLVTTTLPIIESVTVTDKPTSSKEETTVFNHDEEEAVETLITTAASISDEEDQDSKTEINRATTTTPKTFKEENQDTTTAKNEEIESTTETFEIATTTLKIPRKSLNGTKKSSKKGKYLDMENDNHFAAEIYALAMMNVGGSAAASEEQTTTSKPDDPLKSLADWTQIVNLDNSSLMNAVTSEGNDIKSQKIVEANEIMASSTAESELNSVVQTSSMIPPTVPDEDNKIDTPAPTVKRRKKIRTSTVEPTTTEEDNLEDFKFSKFDKLTTQNNVQKMITVTPTLKKSQELTNSIIEVAESDKVTTVRPFVTSTGYEVSEKVEEDDYMNFAVPKSSQMTTTEHLEVTTDVSSPTMPVTTFRNRTPSTTTTEQPTTTEKSTEVIRSTRETVIFTTTPSSTSLAPETTEITTLIDEEILATTTVQPQTTTDLQDDDEITTTMPETTESNDPIVNQNAEKMSNDNETIIENNSDIIVEQETTTELPELIETTTLNFVEIKPLTSTVQTTSSSSEEITTPIPSPSVSIKTETEIVVSEIDEKNKYNTVNEETTVKPPNMDHASTTTTETVIEEESVTEDDYILVTVPSGTSTVATLEANPEDETGSSVAIAITASVLGVVAAILVVVALFVLKKRQNQVAYAQRCRPVGLDAYSLDNVSVYNSVRRKGNTMRLSKRSYGNSAFEDPGLRSNNLTVADLAMAIQNKTAIYDEFKEIPQITVRPDEVPDGCEDRNRYANVIPLPETRVHLKRLNDDEKTEYINANFVKGPKDSSNYYVACQAPMENTITDFWRMIWEQNSKVIIMATDLSENGVEKCADYLPPSVVLDNTLTFGDFTITLKNRENKEKYSLSTVHLKNAQTNTWREIMHFWYQWPDTGVPTDENTVITMLLEARSFLRLTPHEQSDIEQTSLVITNGNSNVVNNNNNSPSNNVSNDSPSIISNGSTMDKHRSLQRTQGPLTVHCSPGTGRTGTIIACDIALRVLEIPPRKIDIPQIVYNIRRGRASSVRTREQYEFIYRVANVYATKLTGPTIEN